MDKCPFCNHPGYEATGRLSVYGCGTMKEDSGKLNQTEYCKDRQIANLTERLEAWRDYGICLSKGGIEEAIISKQKLKDLGEII